MIVDHVGAIYFPEAWQLRAIGRLAFPCFAYCVSYGSLYTKNPSNYLLRLYVFSMVSQYPFSCFFPGLNVGFTLLLGAMAVMSGLGLYGVVVLTGIGLILRCDYGLIGVPLIYFLASLGKFPQEGTSGNRMANYALYTIYPGHLTLFTFLGKNIFPS